MVDVAALLGLEYVDICQRLTVRCLAGYVFTVLLWPTISSVLIKIVESEGEFDRSKDVSIEKNIRQSTNHRS